MQRAPAGAAGPTAITCCSFGRSRLHRQHGFRRVEVLALRHADDRFRAAVGEQQFDLGAAIGHVQRLQDRAGITGREIGQDEFRNVRKLDRDHVAAADPERAQLRGESERALMQVSNRSTAQLRADCTAMRSRRRFARCASSSHAASRRASKLEKSVTRRLSAAPRAGSFRASPPDRSSMRSRHATRARRRARAIRSSLTMRAHWKTENTM